MIPFAVPQVTNGFQRSGVLMMLTTASYHARGRVGKSGEGLTREELTETSPATGANVPPASGCSPFVGQRISKSCAPPGSTSWKSTPM